MAQIIIVSMILYTLSHLNSAMMTNKWQNYVDNIIIKWDVNYIEIIILIGI